MRPCAVLIIEDDPMVTEVNRAYVEASGHFQVAATARTAAEGLQRLAEAAPDLVILDIYLPDLDGVELLKQIRRQDLAVDVIMVTAAQDARTVQEALRGGAMDYIIKPFKFERIRRTLQAYVHMRGSLRAAGAISQEQLDSLAPGLGAGVTQGLGAGVAPGPGAVTGLSPGPGPAARAERAAARADLPKGLTEWTLHQVLLHLHEKGEPLSAAEVAYGTGLSRVTARRYLDYLVQQGQLRVQQQYGPVGRPLYRYGLR